MSENNISRIKIDNDILGDGAWTEMITAFYEENSSTADDMKVLYVAKFGVFKDPKHWGRMLGSMVRTLASGETKYRGLPEAAIERMEAEIAQGFNDVLIGTDSVVVKRSKDVMFDESKNSSIQLPTSQKKNWNPEKIDWPGKEEV